MGDKIKDFNMVKHATYIFATVIAVLRVCVIFTCFYW